MCSGPEWSNQHQSKRSRIGRRHDPRADRDACDCPEAGGLASISGEQTMTPPERASVPRTASRSEPSRTAFQTRLRTVGGVRAPRGESLPQIRLTGISPPVLRQPTLNPPTAPTNRGRNARSVERCRPSTGGTELVCLRLTTLTPRSCRSRTPTGRSTITTVVSVRFSRIPVSSSRPVPGPLLTDRRVGAAVGWRTDRYTFF